MNWLENRWYSDKPAPCWLLPFECIYRRLSRRISDKAKQDSWQAHIPVIVVGNISVGGTGKTPLAITLVSLFKQWGYKPGIISRGYKSSAPEYPYMIHQGSSPAEAGDEPYLLYHRCQCPVVIDPDRTSAARLMLQETDCDLIISDDGLQHYKLDRDVEIVVVDGQRGLGNNHCLPAGPLREGGERLESVDYIISNGPIIKPLETSNPKCFEMVLEPLQFQHCTDISETRALKAFDDQTVHGVAGIGNPDRFFKTLKQHAGVDVVPHAMPDHHKYSIEDISFKDDLPVIMTEKDAVKIKEIAGDEHWYLEVSAVLPDNFVSQLREKLETVKEHKGILKNG